jgi:hypothetical protein
MTQEIFETLVQTVIDGGEITEDWLANKKFWFIDENNKGELMI